MFYFCKFRKFFYFLGFLFCCCLLAEHLFCFFCSPLLCYFFSNFLFFSSYSSLIQSSLLFFPPVPFSQDLLVTNSEIEDSYHNEKRKEKEGNIQFVFSSSSSEFLFPLIFPLHSFFASFLPSSSNLPTKKNEKMHKRVESSFILFAEASSKKRDLYELLGVKRTATQQEIAKAYRKLSKEQHPDVKKGDKKTEDFVEIANAYKILSSPEKRQIYDTEGHDGLERHASGDGAPDDDVFSMFGFGRRRKEKLPPTVIKLRVTLEDLYFGRSYEVDFTRTVLCENLDECVTARRDCEGAGVRGLAQQLSPGVYIKNSSPDPTCIDRGKGWSSNCSACPGGATEVKSRKVSVHVDAGMSDGQTVVLHNVGDEAIGQEEAADLVFVISTIPHKMFTREGNNLRTIMRVDLLDALVGFSRVFRHIDKGEVKIQKQDVTKENDSVLFKGRGMPLKDSNEHSRGDLYVTFKIKYPVAIPNDRKKAIEKLLKDIPTTE